MGRRISMLSARDNAYRNADELNYEGFPSFVRSDRERYVQVLTTNTLGNTFYATSNELLEESLELHERMIKNDPEFAAKAIVYARNEGFMRLQPIVGLAYLSRISEESKSYAHSIFDDVIRTPGDLQDYIEILRGGVVSKSFGRFVKDEVGAWLNKMSEYHAIKYAQGGKGYSLRDILRLTHPKPWDAKHNNMFQWLVDRDAWNEQETLGHKLNHQIAALENLKRTETKEEIIDAIEWGRLPYEVVTGYVKPDVEIWEHLMRQMPYFALLRHLNTLQRAGVTEDRENCRYIADRLRDEEAVRRAMILPFRLYTAYLMFDVRNASETWIRDALVDALENSVISGSIGEERIMLSLDVSGSMSSNIGGGYGRGEAGRRYIDIGAIFAAALFKQNENSILTIFDTRLSTPRLSRRDSMLRNANILQKAVGGGTNLDLPVDYLLANNMTVDAVVAITDNMEWAGSGFLPKWRRYKATPAGKNAKAFLLRMDSYKYSVAPQDETDVYFIYGWSDVVLKYISKTLEGSNQITEIERIRL